MIVVDKMLVGGLRLVLDKVLAAVESEMDDESVLHERLLAAQMELELGQITDEEFAEIEGAVMERLREIRARREGPTPTAQMASGDYKVTGIEELRR